MQGSKNIKVALVGNPNVGKSVFFGRLTKKYMDVSNYPGTTVEISRGELELNSRQVELIDTPGVNSLIPVSEDERITRDLLFSEQPDIVIQVADAKNVQRSLMLTSQLAEANFPTLLALNMADEADKQGIDLDTDWLSQLLGTEAISTVAPMGKRQGERRASKVIRRHRLAERLLNDVIEMDLANIEGQACKFEHAISADVEEKICTLLGHPDECPHGNPRPEGRCCLKSRQVIESAIVFLDEVDMGQSVKVAYISLKEKGRLDRLSSLGILPGASVEVKQKLPAFVVEVEGTQVAMEQIVAENVFVRTEDLNEKADLKRERNRRDWSVLEDLKAKFEKNLNRSDYCA